MIDEEITLREKGYYSYDLKSQSSKKVWAVCEGENCEREEGRGRWVTYQQYRDLCCSCANKICHVLKEEDKVEKRHYIDDDITYAEKGHRSIDLKSNSRKLVWAICANPDCEREGGRGRWVKFHDCRELCHLCACRTDEFRRKSCDTSRGENNPNWKGGIARGGYCKLFNESLKDAVRSYFNNICFKCSKTISQNDDRKMSVHHVNYQKDCGCDNTQFCIYAPLCMECHGKSSNGDRWYWYNHFMMELATRNPNYYAYHIPVVYYDEPSYNYEYVFEKNRRDRLV